MDKKSQAPTEEGSGRGGGHGGRGQASGRGSVGLAVRRGASQRGGSPYPYGGGRGGGGGPGGVLPGGSGQPAQAQGSGSVIQPSIPQVPATPAQPVHSDFHNLEPRRPASAGPIPGGKPGGRHEEDVSEGKTMIYSRPSKKALLPAEEVTKQEDRNLSMNSSSPSQQLKDTGSQIAQRTSFGLTGTSILFTNYFRLQPNSNVRLWRYSVTFRLRQIGAPNNARDLGKRQRRRLLSLLLEHPALRSHGSALATDYNSTIITKSEMNDDQKNLKLKYWDIEERAPGPRSAEYHVTIASGLGIDMADLKSYLESSPTYQTANYQKDDAITALNTIIAKVPSSTPGIFIFGGNRFYSYPMGQALKACLDLGGGLIAVRGYYASVRTSTGRVSLNVHTQTSAFYPPGTVSRLMKVYGFGNLAALGLFLQKLRVKTSYMKAEDGKTSIEKVKTVIRLSDQNARNQTFRNDQGQVISVEKHFLQTYQVRLREPELPLLLVGIITTDKNGERLPNKSEHKYIWLPAELAEVVPGQMYTKKLTPDQTKATLKYAARPPGENARRLVTEGLPTLGFTPNNATLKAFGITGTSEMTITHANVIPPPRVQYQNSFQTASMGSWNMRNIKFAIPSKMFLDPVKPSPWAILGVTCTAGKETFATFQEALAKYGLGNHLPQYSRPMFPGAPIDSASNDDLIRQIFADAKIRGIKVILIILPKHDAKLYSRVKFWADCKHGIHTVYCLYEKFMKKDSMTYANVALKINAKLGGTNHHVSDSALGFLGTDTMVVGIDVTHAGQNSMKGTPSIVGVVASVDKNYALWPGSIRLQAQSEVTTDKNMTRYKTREMVEDLTAMLEERLIEYRKVNKGVLPKRLLVYRDGVSESQYDQVLESEYTSIVNACKKFYPQNWPNNRPPITIIIVGKRHHTRFYPTAEKDSDLAYTPKPRWAQGNCKPGTTVDRGITMEQGFDFFQQAHACLQGTAKPAHYVIIKDELKRTATEYETVTHNLCYHFARATKAVSVCPPAYYADLLCERGRCYIYKYLNAEGAMRDETWDWNRSPWVQSTTPHPDLAGSMFYL